MILLTGATGHLGSHVLLELVQSGREVRALYRNEQKIAFVKKVFAFYQQDYEKLSSNIEWVKADISDYYSITKCIQGIRQVYHVAGLVSFDDRDRKKLNLINHSGTANVVNACVEQGIEQLCHVSSIGALGDQHNEEPLDENTIFKHGSSVSAYAYSKFRGEMEVWRGISEGLNAVIVNPSVIIGPGMWEGLGKQLFLSVQKGLKFYPAGSSGYVDVRDVADIMIRLAEGPYSGERYILSAENRLHRDYLTLLANEMGHPGPTIPVTPFMGRIACWAEKIRAVLTEQSPRINRRTLQIASEQIMYSNDKIKRIPGMTFHTIEESVKLTVSLFLAERG